MKELLKDEYPGDLIISNILNDILRDDQLCKRTLINEIDLYQKNNFSVKKIKKYYLLAKEFGPF